MSMLRGGERLLERANEHMEIMRLLTKGGGGASSAASNTASSSSSAGSHHSPQRIHEALSTFAEKYEGRSTRARKALQTLAGGGGAGYAGTYGCRAFGTLVGEVRRLRYFESEDALEIVETCEVEEEDTHIVSTFKLWQVERRRLWKHRGLSLSLRLRLRLNPIASLRIALAFVC